MCVSHHNSHLRCERRGGMRGREDKGEENEMERNEEDVRGKRETAGGKNTPQITNLGIWGGAGLRHETKGDVKESQSD